MTEEENFKLEDWIAFWIEPSKSHDLNDRQEMEYELQNKLSSLNQKAKELTSQGKIGTSGKLKRVGLETLINTYPDERQKIGNLIEEHDMTKLASAYQEVTKED